MDDYRVGIISEPILGVSYRIVSATVVSADIMCITAGSAAVNRSHYTADQRTFAPVTRCAPRYGRGLEGWEDGDCNLIPASPWHQDSAVLGLGHQRQMTPHSRHQQEVITTVSTVNHTNVSTH